MITDTASAPAVTVPSSVRIGYGFGSICTATFIALPTFLLVYYLTNVMAVPAWLAGTVLFLPKAWDLFINTYVGQRSDRTQHRNGHRRPWLLLGALTLPPLFALTFAGPPLTGIPAAIYVGVMFFLAATAFAFFEVPYKAMLAEMTEDYHERSAILQWRMAFIGLAILVVGAVAPLIAQSENEKGTVGGYRIMGLIFALVLLGAALATYFRTANAPMVSKAQSEGSVWSGLRVARTNRSYLWLLGLSCFQMLSAGILLVGAQYYATYTLDDPGATSVLFPCVIGPMLITMPVWVRLSRRLDKRATMIVATALFMAGALIEVLALQYGKPAAYAGAAVIGVGYAGLQLLQYSMMADVIVADEVTTGKRRAGVFTGLWTAAELVAGGVGALLFGAILSIAGFVSSDSKHVVVQTPQAEQTALYAGTLLPATLMLVAIAMTFKYDLSAARMAELVKAKSAGSSSGQT